MRMVRKSNLAKRQCEEFEYMHEEDCDWLKSFMRGSNWSVARIKVEAVLNLFDLTGTRKRIALSPDSKFRLHNVELTNC